MSRLRTGATTGALGCLYVLLLFSALAPLPIAFFIGAVIAVLAELHLSRRASRRLAQVVTRTLGPRFRMLSLDVLTALLAARLLPDAGWIVAFAVVAILLVGVARDAAGVFARRRQWRAAGGPVSWRNLDVPGLPVPQPVRAVPQLDPATALLGLVMPLGYAVGSVVDRYTDAIIAQWIVIVVVLLTLTGRLVQHQLLSVPDDRVRGDVRAAIERAAPVVVLHHSGRAGTVDQVLPWIGPLRSVPQPVLVLVREMSHIDALASCGLPVVCAPRSQDVELFMVPSVDVALYTSDATNINNHLLRVPGIYDVLVGHGDSDEAESRSPVARMYDEVWVAGEIGRERYASAAIGLDPAKIREIGGVRTAAVTRTRTRPTAVYAPTWENTVDAADLSSLVVSGSRIVEALLARQDVRTIFVPAAPTGSRLPEYEAAVRSIADRIRKAGSDHATWSSARLGEALGEASFAIVDVSPVVAELIRADIPFAVAAGPASRGGTAEEFPLDAAGWSLERFPEDVFRALDDALHEDRRAEVRRRLRSRLDAAVDFESRFAQAIDEAVAAQHRRRAFARPIA